MWGRGRQAFDTDSAYEASHRQQQWNRPYHQGSGVSRNANEYDASRPDDGSERERYTRVDWRDYNGRIDRWLPQVDYHDSGRYDAYRDGHQYASYQQGNGPGPSRPLRFNELVQASPHAPSMGRQQSFGRREYHSQPNRSPTPSASREPIWREQRFHQSIRPISSSPARNTYRNPDGGSSYIPPGRRNPSPHRPEAYRRSQAPLASFQPLRPAPSPSTNHQHAISPGSQKFQPSLNASVGLAHPLNPSTPTRASPRYRRSSPARFVPTLPPAEYIELSRGKGKAKATSDEILISPKLLVLDLNGALVYRNKNTGVGRKSYPRPYLSCFLDYLFLPEPDLTAGSSTTPPERPLEVFVWSSAQPHNVRSMVDMTFGSKWSQGIWGQEERIQNGEGRLLGVWARDKMGLSEKDYSNKVQTFKDLRKVAEHLRSRSSSAEASDNQPVFDERNIILLDDSPLKAIFQPWNQIVIPEYGRKEFHASRIAAAQLQANPDALVDGLDEILLGVIGILEELGKVDNIPAWIRSGGLTPGLKDEGVRSNGPCSDEVDEDPILESLPSHDSFAHWFTDPALLEYWIDRGKAALKRKGIALNVGIDPKAGTSPRHFPPSHFRSQEGTPTWTANGEDLDEMELQGENNSRSGRASPRSSPSVENEVKA